MAFILLCLCHIIMFQMFAAVVASVPCLCALSTVTGWVGHLPAHLVGCMQALVVS